jgi:hypothetical protein
MTGSWEGLGVPSYGAFERYTAAQARVWVGYDGGHLHIGERDDVGDGIPIVATDGGRQRGLLVCADDGGVALSTGWCQAVLGSTRVDTAVSTGNPSIFGTSGELWVNNNLTTTGNLSGLQGAAVCAAGKTVTGNIFGVTLGCVFPSTAVLASSYYTGGAIICGHYEGTMTGKIVGIFFQNPTSAGTQFDYAFAFGQNSAYAGMVTVAAVGGSNTHKLKVIAGGTDFFIPMYTS